MSSSPILCSTMVCHSGCFLSLRRVCLLIPSSFAIWFRVSSRLSIISSVYRCALIKRFSDSFVSFTLGYCFWCFYGFTKLYILGLYIYTICVRFS